MPAPAALDTIFYDGTCGLCHRTVLFALRHDPDGSRFRYAPIGGPTFLAAIAAPDRAGLPDSVVVRTADGRTLVRSAAVRHIGERLGNRWSTLAVIAGLMPRWLLDLGYDGVARIRKRLFAPPPGACPILPPELRERFGA
jgi:predicted DCC family thiol-disulfide oxidoreductase YuxK